MTEKPRRVDPVLPLPGSCRVHITPEKAQELVDEGKRLSAEYRKRLRKMWDVR